MIGEIITPRTLETGVCCGCGEPDRLDFLTYWAELPTEIGDASQGSPAYLCQLCNREAKGGQS